MKVFRMLVAVSMMILLAATIGAAGDFDWIRDFNIRAEADPSGFKVRLATRFQIGDIQINTVLSNVEKPADAYMVFRLGEMSRQPAERVMDEYKSGKGKGWGVIAKSLGIKPGSKEFHSLKRGQDFYDVSDKGKGKGKSKGKGKKN
ncbi:MAG: hypothetical protein A2X96_02540 [Syntrophobacterales bacterium GWC2_56_13]|nr:MAG: hypothetical protein A2X96_02540 [Syntrophobacterales bacterium GWC2_56_13]OHE19523.1 MAG: hypothetical protein A2X95_00590 [Syntrophobacterales bacterium GWF2_56_9]